MLMLPLVACAKISILGQCVWCSIEMIWKIMVDESTHLRYFLTLKSRTKIYSSAIFILEDQSERRLITISKSENVVMVSWSWFHLIWYSIQPLNLAWLRQAGPPAAECRWSKARVTHSWTWSCCLAALLSSAQLRHLPQPRAAPCKYFEGRLCAL